MSLFGQRRRYAVIGVLAARGPCTVAMIGRLARMPRWVVRRDLAKAERGSWVTRVELAHGTVWQIGPACWAGRAQEHGPHWLPDAPSDHGWNLGGPR